MIGNGVVVEVGWEIDGAATGAGACGDGGVDVHFGAAAGADVGTGDSTGFVATAPGGMLLPALGIGGTPVFGAEDGTGDGANAEVLTGGAVLGDGVPAGDGDDAGAVPVADEGICEDCGVCSV